MKKTILILLLACATTLSSLAIPAKKGTRTFTQPDGSTISLSLVGDENFHTYLTTDELPVMRNADGAFVYRTADGASRVVAHDPSQRTATELSYIRDNSPSLSLRSLSAASTQMRAPRRSAPQRTSQVPQTGSPRVPIILVAYKDYAFRDGSNANQTFTDFFCSGSKSAYQYFEDQSNGKYTPQFDVFGPYTLPNNRVYYGGNNSAGYDLRIGQMVAEGCQGLNGEIDFSDYDNDGDGVCDVVIVLYAGDGEASSYEDDCEDAVWPCQWDLASSDYGKNLKLDGTTVSKFAVFNELNGWDLSKIDGIGTFCHEFSHCLDLPDFYETTYDNGYFGMGPWSLMDYGSYNDDGYTPIGYSAYEKNFMGWLDIPEAVANTRYTLPVFNVSAADDQAVKVTNSHASNEYYILENRAKQGWDAYIDAEGMMITTVTYSSSAWNNNTVNNYALQRMTLIPADNALKMDYKNGRYTFNEASLKGDLWPYNGVNELTDTSVPAAKVNTGTYMGKPITEITKNSDGTVSFWFIKAPRTLLDTPVLLDAEGISSTGFQASWTHSSPEDATFTLEVTEHKDVTYEKVLDTDFTENKTSYPGWTLNNTGYYTKYDSSSGCLKLGSSQSGGAFETSNAFVANDDMIVTAVITADKWSSDSNVKLTVSTICDGEECYSEEVAITKKDTYEVPLLAEPDSDTKIRIEAKKPSSGKNRVLIYNVAIWNSEVPEGDLAAQRRAATETGDQTSRTVSGITDTWFEIADLAEGGSFDYRVKAVPVDAENYDESAWSDKKNVVLASPTTVVLTPTATTSARYYNLQGLCVASGDGEALRHLPAGVYVRVRGDKCDKIVIR